MTEKTTLVILRLDRGIQRSRHWIARSSRAMAHFLLSHPDAEHRGILLIKKADSMEEDHEKLKKTSVYLEEEVLEALEEAALELGKETGMKWSKGAVIRLALSDFFTRKGKIL